MSDITLAEKIYDAFLDRDLTPSDINNMMAERLYALLCSADGALSAIRHGRKLGDKELEDIYYPIRDFCNELARPFIDEISKKSSIGSRMLSDDLPGSY